MRNGPYILVVAPDVYPGKKYRGRYVYEHQLVWWQNTGNLVPKGYVVHHRDHDKHNNRFSNLELTEAGVHAAEHSAERKPLPLLIPCAWCSEKFAIEVRQYKTRLKQSKDGSLCCSRSCAAKKQLTKK